MTDTAKLKADALRVLKERFGYDKDELPHGYVNNSASCPIATALDACGFTSIGVYHEDLFYADRDGVSMMVETPAELLSFIEAFDAGAMPELDREELDGGFA